ncbi:hypothetical protein D8B23_12930 [Verminephrobacter aporrectodeae subsp. tuberculatae]|uniref:hypothetical protein n=1 Tax=Verminephrobacter aporrectodeae TaxID=1110389 RepID=UPI0022446FA1|nr:hypothetical protein [Verminephrobacter aporrectodeae]MCW8199304.1 hypothetical protein [Verminephrobacter aporrectodeae subsp. tuberculatae]MCW8207626.1 hypothetical protein [Verminephrobacter aporrectodeae subsp. tuberculatae]
MSKNMIKDVATEGAKAVPPLTLVSIAPTLGPVLNVVLTTVTILYVILQSAWLLWRWRREARSGQ